MKANLAFSCAIKRLLLNGIAQISQMGQPEDAISFSLSNVFVHAKLRETPMNVFNY